MRDFRERAARIINAPRRARKLDTRRKARSIRLSCLWD